MSFLDTLRAAFKGGGGPRVPLERGYVSPWSYPLWAYEPGGTRLTIEDTGAGAPVPAGRAGPNSGGGYGITGMRERAELLGGRLDAGPTERGYRVELWLPA